ncbi:MAG: copper resistance protein B, partial [Arenimonas sp.]
MSALALRTAVTAAALLLAGQGYAQEVDHSAMDHSKMDHSQMDHSQMDHAAMGHAMVAEPKTPLSAITEADRAAAFPALTSGHAHHSQWFSKVLVDELETWEAGDGRALRWGARAWVGSDLNRLWLRSGGERVGGVTEAADVELLFGRGISPWWDVVAGVRHDFRPGDGRDYLA